MSEKEEIIAELRNRNIEFNPNSQISTLKKLLEDKSPVPTEEPAKEVPNPILEALQAVTKSLSNLDARMSKMEGKPSSEYRTEVKTADVESADASKKNIDPRIAQIVEESLGTDFGVELTQYEDKPGFLFTVIVPQRLSDLTQDSRPVRDPETGAYKTDSIGNMQFETYYPTDRRSKHIGSTQSYDAIKDHCDRIRGYIVSYYQRMKQPLPEFKVK